MNKEELTDNEFKEIIKSKIHYLITDNEMYKTLCGYDGYEAILKFTFNFSIVKTTNITNVDLGFFLDNMVAKIIYDNYDTTELVKLEAGEKNNITIGENEYSNIFLQHKINLTDQRICDIENYLDDIKIEVSNEYINISLELPIYNLVDR